MFSILFLKNASTAFQCNTICNTNKTSTTIADHRCISDQVWRLIPINGLRPVNSTLRICSTKPEKLITANETSIRMSITIFVLRRFILSNDYVRHTRGHGSRCLNQRQSPSKRPQQQPLQLHYSREQRVYYAVRVYYSHHRPYYRQA